MQTAVLVLAAGSSSRMGQSKQLLKVNGMSLLAHSVKQAAAVSPNVVVVLGSGFEQHKLALRDLSVILVENKSWQKGMGSSMKQGVAHILASTPEIDSVIIMVCDQPKLQGRHLQKLIHAATETSKTIIASSYAGTVGVPALFKKEQFTKLLNADDDSGARKIIRQHAETVGTVDFPGGHIDLDTPEDYSKFILENTKENDAP